MDEDRWADIGFVISSKGRRTILLALRDCERTPKQLADLCDTPVNHISNWMKQLIGHGLIECLNDAAKKGRIYRLTEKGKHIAEVVVKIIDVD